MKKILLISALVLGAFAVEAAVTHAPMKNQTYQSVDVPDVTSVVTNVGSVEFPVTSVLIAEVNVAVEILSPVESPVVETVTNRETETVTLLPDKIPLCRCSTPNIPAGCKNNFNHLTVQIKQCWQPSTII